MPILSVHGAARAAVALGLGVVLLVPGRLQAWLLAEHFRGRRAHMRRKTEEARQHYVAQLARWAKRPALRHAVWLGWMVYTPRGDAMVWNNISAAHLDEGNQDAALAAADEALALDPLYPLPWVNRAIAALIEQDRDEASRCLEEARRLGYRGTTIDKLVQRTSAAWARAQAASLSSENSD